MKINDLSSSLGVYLRLLKAAKVYWLSFVIGIIATILAVAVDAFFAWAIKPIIDHGLVAREHTFLLWLPVIIVVVFVLRGITLFLSNYYITRVGRNVIMDFRKKIFSHLMHLPASFYDRESSGKLLSLIIYNTEQIAAASTEALLTILQEGLMLIGLIVVMFVISWQLTLLFMLTVPFISLITKYNTKRLRKLSGNVQRAVGEVSHIAEEGIAGYRVIRIFGGERYEKNKFNKAAEFNRNQEMKVVVTNSLGGSLVQMIASLPLAAIVYIATLSSLHVTVGSFGAMIAAILRIFTPIRRLTKINTDIQKGIAGAQSIFGLLDADAEKDDGTVLVDRVRGEVEYRNVSLIYPHSRKEVLSQVSFEVVAGQTIALVGRSGGGKSSLVSLLPRFYEVTEGTILLDGKNIGDYKLTDLRRQFALVSQHLVLFNDTIARNIAYGCLQTVTEKEIIKAAEAAHIMDFIKQLPQGLDTVIGDKGLLLSGGQRQRLAIARAILKNAPILILDEATSALDTESEYYIQEALQNLMHQCTTLVIAHRLSTVEKADKIIVIEKGKVEESGTHQELLATDGVYAKLYRMQFKES